MQEDQPKSNRLWKTTSVVVFFAYLIALTYLLLKPRPLEELKEFKSFIREFFFTYIDPVAHLLCFTILGFLASLAPWRTSRLTLLILLLGYGVLTEVIQAFIPTRTAEWGDLAQDAIGLAIGMWVAGVLLLRRDELAATKQAAEG